MNDDKENLDSKLNEALRLLEVQNYTRQNKLSIIKNKYILMYFYMD